MDKPISSGLKYTFLIHFIVGLFFGLTYLLYPSLWTGMSGIAVEYDMTDRVIGAAVLGWSAMSWFCYRAGVVGRVKIVVLGEIVWTVLATLVILYALLLQGYPSFAWMNAVIMAAFAVAFIVFNPKE
jgi:hypothetical protein